MKIVNATRYDTRQLRSLIVAVYRELVEPVEGPAPWWPRLKVKVAYRRANAYCAGFAYFNGGPILLRPSRPGQPTNCYVNDVRQLVQPAALRDMAVTIAH